MWHYLPESDTKHCSLEDDSKPDGSRDVVMLSDEDPPTFEQGFLFADALNAHEATGLTPSQMQVRVAELEAAINRLKIYIVGLPDGLTRDDMLGVVAEVGQ